VDITVRLYSLAPLYGGISVEGRASDDWCPVFGAETACACKPEAEHATNAAPRSLPTAIDCIRKETDMLLQFLWIAAKTDPPMKRRENVTYY